ncbi:MAG TPA: DUF3696 domain-containing protein [Arcobacter sp.]|nr:DUF3696 domain-containing protein [Arcobacter sp.]
MKIDNVKIKNFKSLRDVNVNLGALTLVTGTNSSGKSSFIQAILLIKQNLETIHFSELGIDESNKKPLNINDNYVRLGNRKDILYQDVYDEKIEISLSVEKDQYFDDKDIYPLEILFDTNTLQFEANEDFLENSAHYSLNEDFQYLQTNRIEPEIFYSLSDEFLLNNNIGLSGEFTAHYLAQNRHNMLDIGALKHNNSLTNQLLENVSFWLGEISEGVEVSAKVYDELQKVNLTYKYTYGDNTTSNYTPLNVGFGLTYVLPVIVAILKAKEGDLLIIENPESHLHPAGQSKIAELCAIASANGVQIIIETHSDHFLNGIRVATKKGLLAPEQSKIYYFRKDKDELETKIDEINIDKDGGIDRYPKGFFDQFDEDLDKLITW